MTREIATGNGQNATRAALGFRAILNAMTEPEIEPPAKDPPPDIPPVEDPPLPKAPVEDPPAEPLEPGDPPIVIDDPMAPGVPPGTRT